MNCSGKHAAMLLACTATGWDTAGYLDAEHPLQAHIRDVIERLTGEKVAATAVDGCGAPGYAVTLTGLARGDPSHRHRLAELAVRPASHRRPLVRAVRENLDDRRARPPDTIVIERLGVFAKGGAEGVMVMVAPERDDRRAQDARRQRRAATAVALRLLERAGALTATDVADALDEASAVGPGGGQRRGDPPHRSEPKRSPRRSGKEVAR